MGSRKAQGNLRKYGVAFELAELVFYDPNALMEKDRVDAGEQRWLAIGLVEKEALFAVVHVIRGEDHCEIIRLVSARRADRKEQVRYGENGPTQV